MSEAEWVKIGSITPWGNNPRINDAAVDEVVKSIKLFGWSNPIIVRKSDKVVIAGHTRLKAAQKLGLDKVLVREMDLDPARAAALALADNKLGEIADWDEDALGEILFALEKDQVDMDALGFSESELEELISNANGTLDDLGFSVGSDSMIPQKELSGGDEAPEVEEGPPDSKLGEVYELGPHRLVCGDSFDKEIQILAGIEEATAVYTDPPYGMNLDVNYDGMHSGETHRKTGERFEKVIADDRPFDASELIEASSKCKEQFWWGADYYRKTLLNGGSWVVWDKRYNEKGMDMDKALGGMFELCWSRQKHRREIARILWSGHHGMQGEDTKSRVHPTQKPTYLAEWFFDRWIPSGSVVFDFFGGSGSTLIAAAKTGRIARLIELDPRYCDVIRRRYTRFAEENGLEPGSGALW